MSSDVSVICTFVYVLFTTINGLSLLFSNHYPITPLMNPSPVTLGKTTVNPTLDFLPFVDQSVFTSSPKVRIPGGGRRHV